MEISIDNALIKRPKISKKFIFISSIVKYMKTKKLIICESTINLLDVFILRKNSSNYLED